MEGHFGGGGGIWLKDSIFLPFCLVFLLDFNKSVSFFSLYKLSVLVVDWN